LRDRDPEIPPTEGLYRSVEADWVDGDRVLHLAIDGEGSSCDRAAHADPQQTRRAAVARRPAENGIAYTTPEKLPVDFLASNGVRYDVFAYDFPIQENEAHCEIRWRRFSDRPATDHFKKLGGAAKGELKAAIAEQMTILIPPTRLADEAAE
jgi:hypothetical protein